VRPKERKEAKRSSFLVNADANLLNIRRALARPEYQPHRTPSLAGSCVMKAVKPIPKRKNNHSTLIARVRSTTRIPDHLRRLSLNGTGFDSDRLRFKRTPSWLLEPPNSAETIIDPIEAAESAGLRYVSDARPGIRRKKAGTGFTYTRADGSKLSEKDVLKRIKALAIPPAWTDVWICPFADGHIQATGRDAKGRKQYRYHVRFREVRESTKYEHVVAFADALPPNRRRAALQKKERSRPAVRVRWIDRQKCDQQGE
jgi:hypothetical protein